MDHTAELLKEITEVGGVPGYESGVRAIMRRHLAGVATIGIRGTGIYVEVEAEREAGKIRRLHS